MSEFSQRAGHLSRVGQATSATGFACGGSRQGGGLWSEFPYSATYRAADSLAGGANGETAALAGQARVTARVAGGQAEGQAWGQAVLAAREAAMLQAGVRGEGPGEELVAAAGYSRRTGDCRKRLTRLLHEELLKMTVPDRPRSPLQKYRLTNQGRAAVATSTRGSTTT